MLRLKICERIRLTLKIGHYELAGSVVLAPMAGVTDVPFRRIARECGAALTVGEMVASSATLRETEKTRRRFTVDPKEAHPVIQLLGSEPEEMAEAARYAQAMGAAIVDINFGCPARVVCGKACGSALMEDEKRAVAIMRAVREAVTVPVTVKMRTGWCEARKNVLTLAREAEALGLDAVTVHGRTREARFHSAAEYDTMARVREALTIPVIANGDIDSPEKAMAVLKKTNAAGVMIGRAVFGAPWLLGEVECGLSGQKWQEPLSRIKVRWIRRHMTEHFEYWGDELGAVRSFRKHVRWYLTDLGQSDEIAKAFFSLDESREFRLKFNEFLDQFDA